MKKYSTLTVCGLAVVAASGVWGLHSSMGQDAAAIEVGETPSARPAKAKVIVRGKSDFGRAYSNTGRSDGGWEDVSASVVLKTHGGPEPMHQIREAAAALSAADDDDAREDAERELNELLNEYFEEDMKRREQELAEVEARVKKLRELLERRREKRDDIIRLQIEVLRNEADGLGFFSGEGPRGPWNSAFQFTADPFAPSQKVPPRPVLPFADDRLVPGTAPPAPPAPNQIPR